MLGNHRLFTTLTLTFCTMVLGAGLAAAQTSPEICELNQLNLISPDRDGVSVRLALGARFGAEIQWADLDDAITTCAVPTDLDDDDFTVTLAGDYKDIVDRQINFFAPQGGLIGSTTQDRVVFQWSNANLQFTGEVSGVFNLSNNGGLLTLVDGHWVQANSGLPMFLDQTNLQGFAVSRVIPDRFVTSLQDRLSRGLWYKASAEEPWTRIGLEEFPDQSLQETRITVCAFSPTDADVMVVGTSNAGLFLSRDGGLSFTQMQSQFTAEESWNNYAVTAIDWTFDNEVLVAVTNLGLFSSNNDFDDIELLDALLVREQFPPAGDSVPPVINDILNVGAGRVLVAVDNYGVYESTNGGADWIWRWTQILGQPSAMTVISLALDPLDDQHIVVGTEEYGVFATDDGGLDWEQVFPANPIYPDEEPLPGEKIISVLWSDDFSTYVAGVEGLGVWTSADGMTWVDGMLEQPGILNMTGLLASNGDSSLLMASFGGGVYVPGSPLLLSDTIETNVTEAAYRDLDFGLSVSFSRDTALPNASFQIQMQDFQGYAVWRSEVGFEDDMQLIGLFDKNNPESCIEGYCGDTSFYELPNCYLDKRAACFDFSDPDTIRFFDDNIYDGFVYSYAVSTFDFGNTATSSSTSIDAEQLYSPRFPDDTLSTFDGPGNRIEFAVNLPSQPEAGGEEIYVYPNPLRNTSKGFTQSEDGIEVNFVNLPPESHIRIFTVNGDLVGDLGTEEQIEHSIKWFTKNTDGELLASGVYIYKVEMPGQDDYFGKLVIIR